MVRPSAPKAAKLKTEVVRDGQLLLNSASFFLVYSSTKASCGGEGGEERRQNIRTLEKKKL